MRIVTLCSIIATLFLYHPATGAEVHQLTPANWDERIPAGKEVDAIYGDYVLRNDILTVGVFLNLQPLPIRYLWILTEMDLNSITII